MLVVSRDLFDSAGDEALAAVGEQMVVAAELLLLVVVWWCVYNLGVRLLLLLLSTTGSVLPVQPWSAGLPRLSTKAREHFHSSPSKKQNHVPPRALPVASPLRCL